MSSSRGTPHDSPAATYSQSAVRPQLTLASRRLPRVGDGIAASGLDTKEAGRLTADHPHEAASTRPATRAGMAVAEFPGLPSQQHDSNSLRSLGGQLSQTRQSPSLKETRASYAVDGGSLFEPHFSLISDNDNKMHSSGRCAPSAAASSQLKTDACERSSRLSRSHCLSRRDQRPKQQLSLTKRRVLSPVREPGNSRTQVEVWTATASSSPCLCRSTPTTSLPLQIPFRPLPRNQVMQKKSSCTVRVRDDHQSKCANQTQTSDSHATEGTSKHFHQTCVGNGSSPAHRTFQAGVKPKTAEGDSAPLHRGRGCLLTALGKKTPFSEISSTSRKDTLFFVHDGLKATGEDGSHALSAAQMRFQTPDPECCALPCGREAPHDNDVPHAVVRSKGDKDVWDARPLGLKANVHGPTCFPHPELESSPASSIAMWNTYNQEADGRPGKTAHAADKIDAPGAKKVGTPRTEGQGEREEMLSDGQARQQQPPLNGRPCAAATRFSPYFAMCFDRQIYNAARDVVETFEDEDPEVDINSNKRTAANAGEAGDFRDRKCARPCGEDGSAENGRRFEDLQSEGPHRAATPLLTESLKLSIASLRGGENCEKGCLTPAAVSGFTGRRDLFYTADASETSAVHSLINGARIENAYQLEIRECTCRGRFTYEERSLHGRHGRQETPEQRRSSERECGSGDSHWQLSKKPAVPFRPHAEGHASSSVSNSRAQEYAEGTSTQESFETDAHEVPHEQLLEYIGHVLQKASSEPKPGCTVASVKVNGTVDRTFGNDASGHDRRVGGTCADQRMQVDTPDGPHPSLDEQNTILFASIRHAWERALFTSFQNARVSARRNPFRNALELSRRLLFISEVESALRHSFHKALRLILCTASGFGLELAPCTLYRNAWECARIILSRKARELAQHNLIQNAQEVAMRTVILKGLESNLRISFRNELELSLHASSLKAQEWALRIRKVAPLSSHPHERATALFSSDNPRREQPQRHFLKEGASGVLSYLRRFDEPESRYESLIRCSYSPRESLRETVASSACLTVQNIKGEAYVPAHVLLQQTGKEAKATDTSTGRACQEAAGVDFRVCRPDDTRGRRCESAPDPQIASGSAGTAAAQQVYVNGRLSNRMSAAFSESDKQHIDCTSRPQGIDVCGNEVLVERRLTAGAPSTSGDEENDTRNSDDHTYHSVARLSSCTLDNAATSISTTRCNSPHAGNSSSWDTTSDCACSLEEVAIEHEITNSSKAASNRYPFTLKHPSHDDADKSQPRLSVDNVRREQARGRRSAEWQLLLQPILPDGLGDSREDTCSSGEEKLSHVATHVREKTHGQWTKVPAKLEGGAGVEEDSAKPESKVQGVTFRRTPHPGWRVRWRDYDSGKERSRCFSVNKYGFEEAKRLAESFAKGIHKKIQQARHLIRARMP